MTLVSSALVLAIAAATAAPAPAFTYAHHAVSTTDPVSQAMFDRGLTLFYSYNGSEGVHVFQALEQREPNLAMAYWGEALSWGPDINTPLVEAHFVAAHNAIEKAVALEAGASDSERAYIDAMQLRFSGSWKAHDRADGAYRNAMAAAVGKYPLDDDLSALYVEALLENSISNAFTPTAGKNRDFLFKAGTNVPLGGDTTKMTTTLAAILARDPQHIMANHLTIHIYEESTDRSRAILSADRLDAMNFAPEDEHLVHMTAHTWTDTGAYAKAVATSTHALALFDAYLATPGIDRTHARYVHHDTIVGFSAAMMLGNYASPQWFAARLAKLPHGDGMSALADARFGRWSDLVAQSPQGANDPVHLAWALQKLHEGDAAGARAQVSDAFTTGANAYLAYAIRGATDLMQSHTADAVANFQKALAAEHEDYTGESIPLFPTSEILGGAYMRQGDYAEAEIAYRRAIERYANDPRALYGLSVALAKEGKTAEARTTAAQFAAVWQNSDTTLTPADL